MESETDAVTYFNQGLGIELQFDILIEARFSWWEKFRNLGFSDLKLLEEALENSIEKNSRVHTFLKDGVEKDPTDRGIRLRTENVWIESILLSERIKLLKRVIEQHVMWGHVSSYDEIIPLSTGSIELPERHSFEDLSVKMGPAAINTFRVAYCLTKSSAEIPGPKGKENQSSIFKKIAETRGTGLTTNREHAEKHDWLGHDMREAIEQRARTVDPTVLQKWLSEWK